ncbi:MAG: ycfH [Rickettsiaceae bacterium]|jgi:TatD DNase family protein|nr:ycfH [Rickettsiaceae bacterium]
MLVDSHCHLNFPDFKDQIDDVVKRAVANDVGYMQTICTKLSEFPQILSIAQQYENIWCSVGVHPNNVENEPLVTAEELTELTKNPKVIGLGETGLDYYYERSPREKQQLSFIEHIKTSQNTGLPVIVHTRSADDDTIDILQEQYAKAKFPGLIHCFSTGAKLAYAAIELGMYISISGIVTFKKAEELQAVVKDLPLSKILVETDAPYLAPMPYRGKTNEPAYTKNTAQFIADLKGVSYDEVAEVTTKNFFELFTKAKR